jgi:3-methyladenine DNA glycosylase/8-oxoguanine DNA glycosylase
VTAAPSAAPLERRFTLDGGADARLTMGALWTGPGDPQMHVAHDRLARAMRLPTGPASLALEVRQATIDARAWGPGAAAALDRVPGLVGELDDPAPLVPHHPLLTELMRRYPGARLTSGAPVIEVLVNAIIGQKVTSSEARRAQRTLLTRFGERAPGPLGLMLPPPPEKLCRLPYWAFHPLGIERRRADTIRAAAAVAARLEEIRGLDAAEGRRRLQAVPGVGPWTAAETMRLALGDPDAVSVGDFNLPRQVCWALAGEENGDDERMLELLEPYRGQRARVVMLIELSGMRPTRRAPRFAPRSIAAM